MDINFILAREQVERAFARAAIHDSARAAHSGMADRYRDMVAAHRQSVHKSVANLRASGQPNAA